MAQFRKKPIVIDAIQWDGKNIGAIAALGGARSYEIVGSNLLINTLEGKMLATDGDWIIKGVRGELYPCNREIFNETYEAV